LPRNYTVFCSPTVEVCRDIFLRIVSFVAVNHVEVMDVLGIDIGGTGMKGAIVDTAKGKLVTERFRVATPGKATPKSMVKRIKEIVDHFSWLGPIGCGFPGVVKHEMIQTAANVDDKWVGKDLSALIKKATGCKAHILNDVDAAGMAEVKFGAGKDKDGTILVANFGTGIGTTFFIDGKQFPNTELGHIKMHGKVAEKYCANSIRKKKDLSWKEWGGRVNEYFQYVEFLFWPDMIIFGGGISKHHSEFFKYIDTKAELVPAAFFNNAGIVGAAVAAKVEGLS